MIAPTDLYNVRTIVTHDNCPDGIASAMILRLALPNAEVVFARYGSAELAALPATPGMLFVDFSPPADRVAEFVAAGAIVLDHHIGQRAVVESFGDRGVFAHEATEPGVCGAVLAYRALDRAGIVGGVVRDFATLAGIRDTWQRSDPRWTEACAQAAALVFWPREDLLAADIGEWTRFMSIGPTLLRRQAEAVADRIKGAHRFRVGPAGARVVVISGLSETSDTMDALVDEAEIVAGFGYHCDAGRQRVVVSCRSRGIDIAALAKRYGGGGHTQAAGFTAPLVPDDPQPYTHVERLLVAHFGPAPGATE